MPAGPGGSHVPLIKHRYGKGRVRVMSIHRDGDRQEVSQLNIKAMLEGDFSKTFTHADNQDGLTIVPRTQRSACGALQSRAYFGGDSGPDSAEQRCTLHRVRDKRAIRISPAAPETAGPA